MRVCVSPFSELNNDRDSSEGNMDTNGMDKFDAMTPGAFSHASCAFQQLGAPVSVPGSPPSFPLRTR